MEAPLRQCSVICAHTRMLCEEPWPFVYATRASMSAKRSRSPIRMLTGFRSGSRSQADPVQRNVPLEPSDSSFVSGPMR